MTNSQNVSVMCGWLQQAAVGKLELLWWRAADVRQRCCLGIENRWVKETALKPQGGAIALHKPVSSTIMAMQSNQQSVKVVPVFELTHLQNRKHTPKKLQPLGQAACPLLTFATELPAHVAKKHRQALGCISVPDSTFPKAVYLPMQEVYAKLRDGNSIRLGLNHKLQATVRATVYSIPRLGPFKWPFKRSVPK